MKRIFALLLTGLLLLSCIGCIRLSCSTPVFYSNADSYTAGNFTYEAEKVKKVEIEWISGGVTLLNGTGTLSVTESGADSLSEEEQMHWWLDGTTLKIKFCKSGYNLSLNKVFNEQKALTVELPAFVDLDIDVASGKVSAENMLNLGKLKLNTASGGTDVRSLSAAEIKVDAASGGTAFGSVTVSGTFKINTASGGLTVDRIDADEVDIDSASGGVTVGVGAVKKMKLDSTSGSIKLTLLDKAAGAKIRYSAVSGNFNTSLSTVNSGDVTTIGDGFTDMEISIVSGSVTVE